MEQFHFTTNQLSQTGHGCRLPGCKPWSQGDFPQTSPNGTIQSNGGVPQAANFSLHVQKLLSSVQDWIPSSDWTGNAVFDFESWTPVFERNDGSGTWHGDAYYDRSLDLVKQQHPDWTHAQLVAAANASFTAAAVEFFATTLRTVRSMRPNALWGFYGFPQNDYYPCDNTTGSDGSHDVSYKCGYESYKGPLMRAQNDRLASVWANSTALYPSIYLPPRPAGWPMDKFVEVNREYVRTVTQEAVRLTRKHGSGPVRPFAWSFYHNGSRTLQAADVRNLLEAAYQPPEVDGVLWWGSPTFFNLTDYQAFANDTLGPIVQGFLEDKCQCARESCGGHGACLPSGGQGQSGAVCACFEGWSGPDCSQPSDVPVDRHAQQSSPAPASYPSPAGFDPAQSAPASYPPGTRSAVGDPGMRLAPRVLMEGWTFCNRAGPDCGVGPRWADCAPDQGQPAGPGPSGNLVSPADNAAGLNASAPQSQCDPYTQQKERDLGALCERKPGSGAGNSSFFWTGMLKSGNMDDNQECKLCGLWCEPDCCPKQGADKAESSASTSGGGTSRYSADTATEYALRGSRLPNDGVHGKATRRSRSSSGLQFDNKPMNQPIVSQEWTTSSGQGSSQSWEGAIFGTWDLPVYQTIAAVRTLAETGSKVPCREYPSVPAALCSASDSSETSGPAGSAAAPTAASVCDLTGVWVGTDRSHAISVAQVNGSTDGRPAVALARAEPWGDVLATLTITPGQGGAADTVVMSRPGEGDETGTLSPVSGSSGPCTGIQWSQGSSVTWCRSSAQCDVPSPGPIEQSSFFQQDWRMAPIPAAPWEHEISSAGDQATSKSSSSQPRLTYRSTMRTSQHYSWLMLYFGADAAQGSKGGYPWDGRGIMSTLPVSSPHLPNATNDAFRARFWLNITTRQSLGSFYFQNWASCWKNNGSLCDGDQRSDVTRYILLDLNAKAIGRGPRGEALTCGPAPDEQLLCPAWHVLASSGERVFPNDTARFPYDAYHYVGGTGRVGRRIGGAVGSGGESHAVGAYEYGVPSSSPVGHFDFFSNPQEQDFIKLAPSAEWAAFGLPASVQDGMKPGWWDVNVGGVTARVPMDGMEPSHRIWTTVNIGPEMGIGGECAAQFAQWEVAGYDVLAQGSQ